MTNHGTMTTAASESAISTPAQSEPQSVVAICCRHGAMMLALADSDGYTDKQRASFRGLNKEQARILNVAGGIADEMLAALRGVLFGCPSEKELADLVGEDVVREIRAAIAKAEGRT